MNNEKFDAYYLAIKESRQHWYKPSKARKWTHDEAKAELAYIQSVNPLNPGDGFNHSRECFARYCKMQETQSHHSGYPLIVLDIEQCRWIAERPSDTDEA